MTTEEPNPLDPRIQGLRWTAAHLDAMSSAHLRNAAARTAKFAQEQFSSLPVTNDPTQQQRCRFCHHPLNRPKRRDALYCSPRCRDRAYRRRRHLTAMNMAELEWTLKLHAGEPEPRCAECGHPLGPEMYRIRRPDQRYCSGRCRTRAWRTRKASTKTVTNTPTVTAISDA